MTAQVAIERLLHLEPDVQLAICGVVLENGTPRVDLQIRRRRPECVDPSGFEDTAAVVPVPAHLTEIVAEEMVKVGRRTSEAALVAPPGQQSQ